MKTKPPSLYLVSLMTFACITLKIAYDVFTGWNPAVPSQPRNFSLWNNTLCQNTDFSPQHKKDVWTMMTDDSEYVLSSLKLRHSLRAHTTETNFDMVAMELVTKPLVSTTWDCLYEHGCQRCVVDRISPLDEDATRRYIARFEGQLTKLHLWDMTRYETLVYLDSDTLTLRSISHLLHINLGTNVLECLCRRGTAKSKASTWEFLSYTQTYTSISDLSHYIKIRSSSLIQNGQNRGS